jgi:hypothetical protein
MGLRPDRRTQRQVRVQTAALSPCPSALGSLGEADLPRSARTCRTQRSRPEVGSGWGVSEAVEAFVTTLAMECCSRWTCAPTEFDRRSIKHLEELLLR